MKTLYKIMIMTFLSFVIGQSVNAQDEFTMQIVIDKGVDAGSLKLYPGVKDPNSYWYLPNKLRLARNEDGTPKLSFLKWVHNEESDNDEGIGGGVLHCVFGFEVTKEELDEARRELRRVNSSGKIIGSATYKSGTVTVSVPKIADPDSQEVVAISPAPTMEGSYVAINLQLDKRSASLLWDSFDTPNPLVTFNFNMVLAGYNSPLEAKITINRDQVYNSQSFQAGVATPWLSAEIGVFVQDLIDNGAITIEKIGDNFTMEAAITKTIDKATEEFFTPFGSSQGPSLSELTSTANSQGSTSFMERASALLNTSRTEARTERDAVRTRNEARRASASESPRERRNHSGDSLTAATSGELRPNSTTGTEEVGSRPEPELEEEPDLPSIAIVASYVIKKVKISGTKVISFKESHPTTIPAPFGGNLGVSKSSCQSCFKEVNLDDDVFKQREIVAMLDGLNESDFDKYINYGTAQIRKKHESDKYTYKEVRITRKNFNDEANNFKMIYGWKDDNDRSKWFDYEFKIDWSFFGGHEVETDWTKTNRSTISLSAPLQRKIITIDGDKERLESENVRAIDVKVFYNLGGDDQIKQVTIDVKKDVISKQIEFMLPKEVQDYDFQITWRLFGNKELKSERQTTSFETLYVDELPNQN